ncbi:MAG: efflux RND transporter periplasmic adaptor subunit [Gemmatimonadaceae bacterium]
MAALKHAASLVIAAGYFALFAGCKKDNSAEAATGDSASATAPASKDSSDGAGATAAAAGDSAPKRAIALPVAGDEARDGDLVLSVTTTGQVRSEAEARLKTEVAGTVERVLVRPGERVRRGQPLVRLDLRQFDLAVREMEAGAAEAEQRYRDEIVPDSIATGRAPTEVRRGYALTRSGLAAARVRLDKARLDRERATIVAPFSGVVDRVEITLGERVQPGQSVTTLVDLDNLRIEAAVLEHDLPLIRVGGEATVTSAAAPDRPSVGRVTAVLPLIDSTSRAGRVFVRVPGNGVLRPGMYADVRLEAARLPGRRLVPAKGVIERDGRPLVFVVKGGRAQWVYITPGRTNGRDTEVLPDSATGVIPVEAGDLVITEGHLTLTHDAPVRVVKTRDP